jgi:hypothetical protein
MARKYQELRADMTGAAKAASEAEHRRLIEAMSPDQFRKVRELTKTKIEEEQQTG